MKKRWRSRAGPPLPGACCPSQPRQFLFQHRLDQEGRPGARRCGISRAQPLGSNPAFSARGDPRPNRRFILLDQQFAVREDLSRSDPRRANGRKGNFSGCGRLRIPQVISKKVTCALGMAPGVQAVLVSSYKKLTVTVLVGMPSTKRTISTSPAPISSSGMGPRLA